MANAALPDLAQMRLAVIPDHRLLRRRRAERADGPRRALQAFTELRPGDIVVHTDHGIGYRLSVSVTLQ